MTLRRQLAKVFRRIAYEIDRSLFAPAAVEVPSSSPPREWTPAENFDPVGLSLRDAGLSGWYSADNHELYPGFRIDPQHIVADVGCGAGGNAGFCARLGGHLILVDVDRNSLETARQTVAEFDPEVEALLSDGGDLPISDGRCTRVVCTEVIEHVEDPGKFLAELVRIGAPGALYLLTVPGTLCENVAKQFAAPSCFEPPNHIRILQPEQFANLVTDAGLMIESVSSYGAYQTLWWWLFWCDTMSGLRARHPVLDHLGLTWQSLLDAPHGMAIKKALDEAIPKSQVIVARKP